MSSLALSVCRADPTDEEMAEATAPGDAAGDFDTYITAISKHAHMPPPADVLSRGARNRPFVDLAERDRLRSLGREERAPPLLPTLAQKAEKVDTLPFVSVVVPTSFTRHWSHATLFKCWKQQTYSKDRREMLVLDTGGAPSPFFTTRCRDRSVRYFHVAAPPPAARTVGGKRNWLAGKVSTSCTSAALPHFCLNTHLLSIATAHRFVPAAGLVGFEGQGHRSRRVRRRRYLSAGLPGANGPCTR